MSWEHKPSNTGGSLACLVVKRLKCSLGIRTFWPFPPQEHFQKPSGFKKNHDGNFLRNPKICSYSNNVKHVSTTWTFSDLYIFLAKGYLCSYHRGVPKNLRTRHGTQEYLNHVFTTRTFWEIQKIFRIFFLIQEPVQEFKNTKAQKKKNTSVGTQEFDDHFHLKNFFPPEAPGPCTYLKSSFLFSNLLIALKNLQ